MSEDEENKVKTNKLDVGEETEAKLKEILEGGLGGTAEHVEKADKEKRVEFEREETFDEPAQSVDPELFDNPAAKAALGDVNVSEYEKEVFYEALIQDEPFQLSIEVVGDKTVTIGSRNTYEQALCYACVGDMLKEAQEAEEASPDILLWIQRFSCAFAVHRVFDKPMEPLSFQGDSEKIKPEHKQQLRDYVNEHYVNMSYPRWQTILNAFMVFTAKEKILLENVGNRDFWIPAG